MDAQGFCQQLLDQRNNLHVRMCNAIQIGEEWQIAERRIADHLLYYLSSGSITATINRQTITVKAGEVLWVQPQQLQQFSYADNKSGTIYFMRFALGHNHALDEDYRHMHIGPIIEHNWQTITTLHTQDNDLSKLRLRCILSDMCLHILSKDNDLPSKRSGLRQHQEQAALAFIHMHLHVRFSIEQIAQHLDMNTDYFTRQFKRSFGITAQAYIKQERIRQACGLLSESGRSISEVAEMLGYEDPYFFSRQFKSVMKQSPRHWLNSQVN